MRTARLLLACSCILASAACSDPTGPREIRSRVERIVPLGQPSTSTGLFGSGSVIPDPAPPLPPVP